MPRVGPPKGINHAKLGWRAGRRGAHRRRCGEQPGSLMVVETVASSSAYVVSKIVAQVDALQSEKELWFRPTKHTKSGQPCRLDDSNLIFAGGQNWRRRLTVT